MNILAFACSKSLTENLAYGIYYDPVSRNHNQPFSYLGFYDNQIIVALGEVSKIVACDLVNGALQIRPGYSQKLTQLEEDRIINTIKTSGYQISRNHKFILVDNVTTTNFAKGTPGPLRWKTYISLSNYPNILANDPIAVIAQKLNRRIW